MDIKEAFYKQKMNFTHARGKSASFKNVFHVNSLSSLKNYAVPVFPLILFTGMTQLYLSIQPVPVFVSMGMTASLFTLHI